MTPSPQEHPQQPTPLTETNKVHLGSSTGVDRSPQGLPKPAFLAEPKHKTWAEAFSAELVATWKPENRARYTVGLYTGDQMHSFARAASVGTVPCEPCEHCHGTGEFFDHADDCTDDLCALNGDMHSCAGQVVRCSCFDSAMQSDAARNTAAPSEKEKERE